ncbi:MAG: branched-chain amino acid ABC transporter permease [Desulfovermiculus sp.]|nr:branched-chain amino acid ABC transporter permease [Desulfovermiculus sp.]
MLDLLIFGLINCASLAVLAIGFSLTFGISGIPNFAYGGLYILSAYLCWYLINIGIPHLLAIAFTLLIIGALGYLIYWLILFRVRGNMLSEAIVTFGTGLFILEFLRWLGFVGFHYNLPVFLEGSIQIFGIYMATHNLIIICVGILMGLFLWFFTHYTKTGRACRGIAQEEYTALSLGIGSDFTAAISLAIGSAFAALAAITILPMQTLTIDKGYDALIFALAVGIVGGLESIVGVLLASLLLGYAQTVIGFYIGSQWTGVIFMGSILLVLAIKPSGLLGKFKELEERV